MLSFLATVCVSVILGLMGSPFWGASSFFAVGAVLFFLRRYIHKPLPDIARGAFSSAVSFIAIAGISLAVMTLIVVISVMDGFTADIQNAILKTTAQVTVTNSRENIDPRIAKLVSAVPGVIRVDPYIENNLLLKIDGVQRPVPVRLRGETLKHHVELPGPELLKGDWTSLESDNKIFIGEPLAENYFLEPGDHIWLITAEGAISPMGVLPGMEEFEIAGIFRTGFYEVDYGTVITGLETAGRVLSKEGNVSGFAVTGTDLFQAPELAERIRKEVDVPLRVMSWAEMRKNMYKAMKTERVAMFIIESLLILIASFNISSTLFMAISRKTREIGLLKALGMKENTILALFTLEGFLIGALGTVIGVLSGAGFSVYLKYFPIHLPGGGSVYYIDAIPVHISWSLIFITTIASLLLSLVAAYIPAREAAKLAPARALRVE